MLALPIKLIVKALFHIPQKHFTNTLYIALKATHIRKPCLEIQFIKNEISVPFKTFYQCNLRCFHLCFYIQEASMRFCFRSKSKGMTVFLTSTKGHASS
jgi:hypothetical protein